MSEAAQPDANLSRWNDAQSIERALAEELQRANADVRSAEQSLGDSNEAWSKITQLRDARYRVAVRHQNAQAATALAKESYERGQREKLTREYEQLCADCSESTFHANIEALVAQSAELQRQQDLLSERVQLIAQERERQLVRAREIARELHIEERVIAARLGPLSTHTLTPLWWQWSARFPWLVGRVLHAIAPSKARFSPMSMPAGASELLRQSMGETPAETELIDRVSKRP